MPIPLDDPLWGRLTTAYGLACGDVLDWLRIGYSGGLTSEILGDIINDIQHQGDTSQAMYAVAPHLLALSPKYPGDVGRDCAIHAGLILASAQTSCATPCPAELLGEFEACAAPGRKIILSYLVDTAEFDDFKYLVAALAGFSSHGRFGRLIADFELFKGQFHHSSLEEPFPEP